MMPQRAMAFNRFGPGQPNKVQRGRVPVWAAKRRYMRAMNGLEGFDGFGGFGADERLLPQPEQIVAVPSRGLWYRLKKGDTYWGITKTAYGKEGLPKMLFAINDSGWNNYIDRRKKGWEGYNRKGIQATPDYSLTNVRAPKGSGKAYPLIWLPPMDLREPEEVYPDGVGPIGPQGETGIPGPRGPAGAIGPAGRSGPKGGLGPMGPVGARGPAGPAGSGTGDGSPGPMGPAGPRGSAGVPGAIGPIGPRGLKGDPGQATKEAILEALNAYIAANPDQFRGPRGATGPAGAFGPSGALGPVGPRGALGPVGPVGPRGATGAGGIGGGGGEKPNLWLLPGAALILSLFG